MINKNGNLFVFDHGNRLRTAQGTDTYRYDAQGRRVRTAGSDGLLYEMYSLDGKLLWQRDEQLGLRFQHIYLGGSLVASRRMPIGETVYGTIYRHTDALGSPIAATDELSNTLQTTEHEPYGKMLNRTNDNRPGYTGHMMDKATGLVYMQQRYYDPLIPRFLSVDPITAYSNPVGAFNRYWYGNNNPYRYTDPDGRQVSAPRSCHSDNSCVSLEQAQAQIGRDGNLMLKIIGGSAAVGATMGVSVESGMVGGVVRAAKDKTTRRVAKETLCAALSLGNCSGKEQMKHPKSPRPDMQRAEDRKRVAESIEERLRRNVGEQPGPMPPKPPSPNSRPTPQPVSPMSLKSSTSPCKLQLQC